MNIPDIDFTRIRSLGPTGQRGGFEQFLCQQVAQESPVVGARFVSLHGDGGDGGVECYWTLPNGDEHGWQAKYWTSYKNVDKAQIDKSVDTALKQHPSLKRYTIAIPVDPTGRTGGRGKSLLEKITDPGGWLDSWQSMATDRGLTVEVQVEWRTNLIERLNRLDTSGTERRYWFDVDVLSDQWWENRKQEAVDAARPRYMPELSIEVPAARAIAAFCSDDEWWQEVLDRAHQIDEAAGQLRYASEALAADLDAAHASITKVAAAVAAWHSFRTAAGLDEVARALDDASAVVVAQEALESDALTVKHGEWDSVGWRQWQSEYMVRFPAAAVDFLREVEHKLVDMTGLLVGPEGRLAGSRVALMTGPAGIGKTYLAIDAVLRRLAKGRPSVMMHGRWFNDHEPLAHLRDVLQMPTDLTSEETLALLDESARAAGAPTLLVIDALNDTRPRSLWRDNLDRLITIIGRYPNLRLLLTARTHYVAQVLPLGLTLPRFEHTGFEGVEFEAVSEYAGFYGLEPPTSPPIHGEFDNPLYLRLVCEALRADSRLSLDQASMGLGELTNMVLDNANSIISDRVDASPSDRVVHRAVHALAATIADADGAPLTRQNAQTVLTSIWSDVSSEKSLLDALIAQGLVEEDVIPDGSQYGTDIVAITFERIGHHLIVSDALNEVISADDVEAQFAGRLGRLLGLGGTIDLGILEATSVVVADRLGLELTEFRTEIGDDDALVAAVIAGVGWRSASSITDETADVIVEALGRRATVNVAMTMLFRLAARPKHPLNASFLHDFLVRWSMGARDAFLPGWLHITHGTSGAVDRLIRWGRERSLDQVSPDTTCLWVTALLWTTVATDRRVREPATVAAARLLARHPNQAAGLIERFAGVNDEWVVERALVTTYSALLAKGATADWRAAAEVVCTRFFEPSAGLTPNAAVRDAARSILEAAAERGALPTDVAGDQFRPPYASTWPLDWPTADDIEPYDNAEYPKLVYSTINDDFYQYRIRPDFADRPGVDVAAAARWIVAEAMRLGYRPELHGAFDRYVLAKFGAGRGKPKWIERIGKKYQRIALNRLIGHVSDHAPKMPNSWDPPAPPVPGPATGNIRQIDPTVVESAHRDEARRPWVPIYHWTAAVANSDAHWVADDTDLPSIDVLNAEHDQRAFVVLSGFYNWNDEKEPGKRSRAVWAHLYSHFVDTVQLPEALAQLESKNLIGHDVSHSPGTTSGYVGEFPYGHHHGEAIHVINHERRPSGTVVTEPGSWTIECDYEYATGEDQSTSIKAPSPALFGPAPGNLRWNGCDGWNDTGTGQLIAMLRRSCDAGQSELLIDATWLEDWLQSRQKSLIWVENTGKDVYRGLGGGSTTHPGALTRSLVHAWTPGGPRHTATPGWQRIPARGE